MSFWRVVAQMAKLAMAFVYVVLNAGCQPDAPTGTASAHAVPQAATMPHESGRKIYNFRCYYCHGYSGDAKTLATTYLSPKPFDFTAANIDTLDRERTIASIRDGRTGTAMASFRNILTQREIELVADFVREEFMVRRAQNTRYHTTENGWPAHERYRDAYPFATGEIGVDTPWDQLDELQTAGKRLYLASCVSCHDRGRASHERVVWDLRAVSYPPNQDSCTTCHSADGNLRPSARHMANASHAHADPRLHPTRHAQAQGPYAVHDTPPQVADLTAQERHGETVYQKNCAFCHAADGTGRNWIGSFLEPNPRDFTNTRAMAGMTRAKLIGTVRDGVPGTSMPAWKSVLEEGDILAVGAYISRVFQPKSR